MLRKGGGRAPPAPGRRELGGERGSRAAARKPCQTAVAAAASRLLRTVRPPSASRHAGTGGRACRDAGTACGAACSHEAHGAVRAVLIGANRNQIAINAPPGPGAVPPSRRVGRRPARMRSSGTREGCIRRRSVARECGVSGPTANAYFGILDATLLARWLPAWRRRAARRLMAGPKLYVEDVRVVNRLARRGERSAVPTPPGRRSRTGCSTSSRRTSRIATSTSNCTSRGIDMLPATDFARRLRRATSTPRHDRLRLRGLARDRPAPGPAVRRPPAQGALAPAA